MNATRGLKMRMKKIAGRLVRLVVGLIVAPAAAYISPAASANYQGFGVQLYTNSAGHDAYRVYAFFTNANDYLTNVYADAAHPIIFQTYVVGGQGGTNFFNPGGINGNTAP